MASGHTLPRPRETNSYESGSSRKRCIPPILFPRSLGKAESFVHRAWAPCLLRFRRVTKELVAQQHGRGHQKGWLMSDHAQVNEGQLDDELDHLIKKSVKDKHPVGASITVTVRLSNIGVYWNFTAGSGKHAH